MHGQWPNPSFNHKFSGLQKEHLSKENLIKKERQFDFLGKIPQRPIGTFRSNDDGHL